MNSILRTALLASGLVFATQAMADVTFFEREGFEGRSFKTERQVGNLERFGFNDRASSAIVIGERWEVCDNARFEGRCVVLRPGRYPSLAAMGLGDRVSSVRIVQRQARIDDNRYAPEPMPVYDSRRRNKERVFEAEVTSVRAVVGQTPEQRCWVDREQVGGDRGSANVGGAVLGALIGGVLGHQVGSGRGNDAATAGGAVAGAAIGANVNRDGGQQGYFRDVRRCENVSQAQPSYWEVTYTFRGQEHRIQTAAPPGRTVMVNARGEPRA